MKTNFLYKQKQGLFLLIAVLGVFASYAQNSTIGGTKIYDTDPIVIEGCENSDRCLEGLGPFIPSSCFIAALPEHMCNNQDDTGGGNSTIKPPIPMPILSGRTVCVLSYTADIYNHRPTCYFKGTFTDTSQVNDIDDIGGNGGVIIGRPVIDGGSDIGGGQTMPTPTKPVMFGFEQSFTIKSQKTTFFLT